MISAIPQLVRMASANGRVLNLRCPYQAKVMKTFDRISRPIVRPGMGMERIGFRDIARVSAHRQLARTVAAGKRPPARR